MLKDFKESDSSFTGAYSTSCKDWEDFNVAKVFNKALSEALKKQVDWQY